MNRTKLITSILLCLVYVGTSWGAEVSLFEQDFLRNKGKRDKYEETFAANEGEARLIISNGDEEGKNRVKRAAVFLNGKKIKTRLTKKKSQREINVNLLAENTLLVKLAGKRQGHLKVQVMQDVDTDASSVDVTLFDKEYLRSKGRPDAFQDSFVGQTGEGKLIVRGIGESGKKKMRIASVSLNGEKIAGPRHLVRKGDQQEFTVNLLGENSVSVKLFGKPGRGVQVQVVQKVEAVAAAVIGPDGGVVAVEDVESPIYGAKIEVPAGALDEDIVLTMKEVEATKKLPKGVIVTGPVIDFGPEDTAFKEDVSLTLPYYDEDIHNFIDEKKYAEKDIFLITYRMKDIFVTEYLKKSLEHDTERNLVTATIKHFSLYGPGIDTNQKCSIYSQQNIEGKQIESIYSTKDNKIPGAAFDVVVSLYNDPQGTEREHYEDAMRYWADAICEQTNGIHRLRTVRIFTTTDGQEIDKCLTDVDWKENGATPNQGRSDAMSSGFGFKYTDIGSTVFPHIDLEGMHPELNNHPRFSFRMQAGYTLGHEWGHYAYGLLDEYIDPELPCQCIERNIECDAPSTECDCDCIEGGCKCKTKLFGTEEYYKSIMGAFHTDVTDTAYYQKSPNEENCKWLNFSSGDYINSETGDLYKTTQGIVYGMSAWSFLTTPVKNIVLSRNLSSRDKIRFEKNLKRRIYYTELAKGKSTESEQQIDLIDHQDQCRALLNVIWTTTSDDDKLCKYPFPDIKCDDAFSPYIDRLYEKGIIGGHDDGLFQHTKKDEDGKAIDEKVNRAQFAKMLVNASEKLVQEVSGQKWEWDKLPVDLTKKFSDIPDSDIWYAIPVGKLRQAEIISGHPPSDDYSKPSFKPDNKIIMAEMLKMVAKTFFPVMPLCNEPGVKKCEGTKQWFAPYITYCNNKILPIQTNNFRSVKLEEDDLVREVTRKEAVKAIYDAYNYCKDNPDECTLLRSGE